MNYNLLMDLAIDLGYSLAMSGAETFRVEESMTRLLTAYGVDSIFFSTEICYTIKWFFVGLRFCGNKLESRL